MSDIPISDITARIEAIFAPWNRSDAPGLSVGILWEGRTLYRRGFGLACVQSGSVNGPATKMRIGSTSKHFTALLALLLAEDGKLDLDVPIRQYIPELQGRGGDASIRMLLLHRGGSRCFLDLGFIGHGMTIPPRGTVMATQIRQPGENFPMGDAMIYNNGGYHMVSVAIERAGGAPFEDQLKQRLFDPLGMADTASVPSDLRIDRGLATLHVPEAGGGWRRGIFPTEELRGEGAIISTVDDMLRWLGHFRSKDRFGLPASWAALTDAPPFPDGTTGPYALGLMIGQYRGTRIVHHAGGVIGGVSQMIHFPDHGLDIVILCNGGDGADPVNLAEQIADVLLEESLGPRAISVDAASYAVLLGQWWSPDTGMIYGLCEDAGALKLSMCGAPVGLPLTGAPDGRAVLSVGSVGDICVDLDGALGAEQLNIEFGGHLTAYRRLPAPCTAGSGYVDRIAGDYVGEDGTITLTISADESGARAYFQDGYGASPMTVQVFGEQVAVASAALGGRPFHIVLTFPDVAGPVPGLSICTTRTRNFRFERRQR